MADDMGEKTEAPTSRKLSESRQQGKVPKSQDFGSAFDLAGAAVLLLLLGSGILGGLLGVTRAYLDPALLGQWHDASGVGRLCAFATEHALRLLVPFLVLMVVVVAAQQLMQVGLIFSFKPIQPNFSRLNPLKGIKRLFSRRNLVKTGVSVLKLAVVGTVAVALLISREERIASLALLGVEAAFTLMAALLRDLVLWMLLLMLIVGFIDMAYQKWQHRHDLRMTKQEVKDERKSMEGDIDTKARRLKLGRQMILQRLRQAVPRADVIVTNPTHFAVALRYDPDKMGAPRVVAKGADYLAFRIREIAAVYRVPIVERPELARALYASAEVGRQIRPEFYEAVAEILAYVYRLEGRAA